MSNGKGDRDRVSNYEAFRAGHDRTFGAPLCPCGTVPDDECGCAAEIRAARARNNRQDTVDAYADYRALRHRTLATLPPKPTA